MPQSSFLVTVLVVTLTLAAVCIITPGGLSAQPQAECGAPTSPPPWAYGFASPPEPDTTLRTLAGSPFSFTLAQIRDPFGPADWYPDDHPPMPDTTRTAKGVRKTPGLRACPTPISCNSCTISSTTGAAVRIPERGIR